MCADTVHAALSTAIVHSSHTAHTVHELSTAIGHSSPVVKKAMPKLLVGYFDESVETPKGGGLRALVLGHRRLQGAGLRGLVVPASARTATTTSRRSSRAA